MPDNAAEIRPGVLRPDWSAVTKPAARQALAGRIAARAGLLNRWSQSLDPDQDLAWRATLQLYADLGRAPRVAELAARTGLTAGKLPALLSLLERRDLIGVDRTSGQVRLAYPFTQAPTEHRVELNGRTLRALCAIDALGVAAMYDTDVTIRSRCRHCGLALEVETGGAGRQLRTMEPPDAVVWYDFAYEGKAAISCCPSIAFFCSQDHLQQWRRAQGSSRLGVQLAMDEALEVGRAIFGPVLAEARPSRERHRSGRD